MPGLLAASLAPSTVVAWLAAAALVPMLVLVVWIVRGWSRPSLVLVAEGFQMWALSPSWPILAGALVTRRWWLAAPAAIVAGAHLWWCARAVRRAPVPAWVATAPTFTLLAGNVLYVNERRDEVAALVMERDADVVVLNETTESLFAALDRRGASERYRTRLATPGRPFGETLMVREDVGAEIEVVGGNWVPTSSIAIGGRAVHVMSVHVKAPKDAASRNGWRRNLTGFGDVVARTRDDRAAALVLAGDFNAAPWHGPFRRLLATGVSSVHGLLGRGLSRSWTPHSRWLSWLGPLMRLDHVLVSEHLFPVALDDVSIPGSDHRGIAVTLAVEPCDAEVRPNRTGAP